MRALINRLFKPSKSDGAQEGKAATKPSAVQHSVSKADQPAPFSPDQLAEQLRSAVHAEQVQLLLAQLDSQTGKSSANERPMIAIVETAAGICEPALAEVAIKSRLSRVRKAAAEALTSSASLESAAAGLRQKDKGAYAVVRQRLDERRHDEERLKDASKQWHEIEADLDGLMSSGQWHRLDDRIHSFSNRIRSARELGEVNGETPAALLEMAAALDRKMADATKAIKAMDRDLELKTTIDDLQTVVEELKAAPLRHEQLPGLAAIITTQANRWSNACEMAGYNQAPPPLQKQCDTLFRTLRDLESGLVNSLEAEPDATHSENALAEAAAAEEANVKSERDAEREAQVTLLDNLLADAGLALRQKLTDCKTALDEGHVETAAKLLADFDAGSKEFQIRAAAIRKGGFRHHRAGSEHLQSVQNARQSCSARLHELRNWQDFAAAPKRQQLLDSAEQLAVQSVEPRIKSERMKSLRADWQQLGHGSDRQTNAAFEAAMRKIQASCRAYFEEEKRLRELNQARREEILTALAKLADSDDLQSIDLQALQTIAERSRQEWREAFPVDRSVQARGQREFDRLLTQVEQPLEMSRQQGEDGRRELIDGLQSSLKQHEAGTEQLAALIEQAKSAQHAWKDLPRTWHKADRALWQSFRAVCDSIFQLRDGEEASQNEAIETATARLTVEADQLKAMVATLDDSEGETSPAEREARVLAAAAQFERMIADETDALKQQAQAGSKAASTRIDRLQKSQFNVLVSVRKRVKQIATNEASKQQAAAFDRIFAAMDLAGNLEAPPSSDRHWLPSAASQLGLKATDAVNPADLATRATTWLNSSSDEIKTGLRLSIVKAEIATGAATPAEDQSLRMSLQMQRLAEAGQLGSDRTNDVMAVGSKTDSGQMPAPLLQALVDALGALLALHLALSGPSSPDAPRQAGAEVPAIARPAELRQLADELIRRWRALTDCR